MHLNSTENNASLFFRNNIRRRINFQLYRFYSVEQFSVIFSVDDNSKQNQTKQQSYPSLISRSFIDEEVSS